MLIFTWKTRTVRKYRCRKSGPDTEFISRRPSEAVAIKWIHVLYIYMYVFVCVYFCVYFVLYHAVRETIVEVNLGRKRIGQGGTEVVRSWRINTPIGWSFLFCS